MNIKSNLRKAAELGVGMTAIATLFIAGCGGGGGGGSGSAASGAAMNITPALGQFKKDAHVRVYDKTGHEIASGLVNASGVAAITLPAGATGPFLIGAGENGDQYYDENSAGFLAVSGVAAGGAAIRAVVPNSAASAVGVTPFTEMAAALLTNASGVLSAGATAASAVGANATIAANIAAKLGLTAGASILTPPTPVAANGVALGTTQADEYAKLLHTLAHLGAYGANPLEIARNMRDDAADGKFDGIIGTGASAVTKTSTLNAAISTATTTAHSRYSGAAPSATTIDTALDLKVAMEAAENENEEIAKEAASTFSSVFAASGVAAAQAAAASAVASATQLAAAATPIAAAKTLLTSLRTNGNLLHNTGKTGFIDQQFAAAQTDFNSISGSAHGFHDLQKSILGGLDLLRTNAPVGTSTNAGGIFVGNVCKVAPNGTAVCQWYTSHQAGWAAHQLTLTKTGATTYTWSDSLIGGGAWSTFPTALYGNATAALSGNTAQTGTITAVYGANSWTSLDLSGNIQPPYLPTTSHDHTAIATNGSVSTSGGNNTITLTGSIDEVTSTGVHALTLSLNTGTSIVGNSTTGAPVSAHLALQGRTVNYQFDGTLDLSDPAQDLGGIYYLRTNSFTGSVSHRTNSAVGSFMTGTLSLTLDDSHLNQSLPLAPGVNYSGLTSAFTGSITNRTVTPAMAYQVTAHSSQPWTTSVTAGDLTYTDPGNNTVTVTWNDTPPGPGIPATVGTVTMGSISISGGNVYSGTTLIGTVSGPLVNFIDGTFLSMQ